MLVYLHESLDFSCALDICVFACALCVFWTQARLGELLPTNSSLTAPGSIPRRRHLLEPTSAMGSRSLHFPRTKLSQIKGEEAIITRQLAPCDPVDTMDAHLLENVPIGDDPLFVYNNASGRKCLTKKVFLSRCNDIWALEGLPRISGHSFRIGGTTHLLESGVAPDVVKKTGRWSSDSFLRYWRGSDSIIPLHTENLYVPVHAGLSGGEPCARSAAAAPSLG